MNLPQFLTLIVVALIVWLTLRDRRQTQLEYRQSSLRGVLEKTKDKCLGGIKRVLNR